jgi:hypothetical protein
MYKILSRRESMAELCQYHIYAGMQKTEVLEHIQ